MRRFLGRLLSLIRRTTDSVTAHVDLSTPGHITRRTVPRERRGFPVLSTVAQDFRYALRTCRRSPGFTFVAVLTLTAGIGANTAVFSLVDAALLTPLPYPDPSRIVVFMTTAPEGPYSWASEAKFNAWRTLTSTFDNIAAFQFTLMNVAAGDHFEHVAVSEVSADFFPLFGARTQAGRAFSAAEDSPGGDTVGSSATRSERGAFSVGLRSGGRFTSTVGPTRLSGCCNRRSRPQSSQTFMMLDRTSTCRSRSIRRVPTSLRRSSSSVAFIRP